MLIDMTWMLIWFGQNRYRIQNLVTGSFIAKLLLEFDKVVWFSINYLCLTPLFDLSGILLFYGKYSVRENDWGKIDIWFNS